MIKLTPIPLDPLHIAQLATYQKMVDNQPDYAESVKEAKLLFSKYNKKNNHTFKAIREKLAAMNCGVERCSYCEDSYGDEIEHIHPKDLYPEKTFVWDNYLLACGPCNGPKNNQFAVFPNGSDQAIEIARKPKAPIIQPVTGDKLLIDPRTDNPLDFLFLELNTFYFLPLTNLTPRNCKRAEYTISILKLNKREYLREARKNAYAHFCISLTHYIDLKTNNAATQLPYHIRAIQRMPHQTVWQEMKRQHPVHDRLRPLFSAAPEALTW